MTVGDDAERQYKDEVAKRLKLWRRSVLKRTQDEFAADAGLNINLIKKYENQNLAMLPSTPSLLALANTGLNLHWLLTGQGRMSMSAKTDVVPADERELMTELKLREVIQLLDRLDPQSRMAMVDSLLAAVESAIQVAAMEDELGFGGS